ncbi:methyl-accepting chemotaxis protein [Nitrincola alkalilacustris]|uniref:methyl-accepting chemotaxis protein n=1 Tax=Nitrincola alkalilacustris TaxID=1571224 RepID=UPI0014571E17|nr:methyl-accepting chemotaxis protein [Nitrincola alkalilacustris]
MAKFQLALTVVFALILVISIAGLFSLQRLTQQYDNLLETELTQERTISAIAVDFNTQVQAWNYLMIRGFDNTLHDLYWQQFNDLQASIEQDAQSLLSRTTSEQERADLERFINSYATMMEGFHAGYELYQRFGMDFMSGDNAVREMEVEPASILQDLAAHFAANAERGSAEIQASSAARFQLTIILLVTSVLLVSFISAFFARRYFIKPMMQLIKEIKLLAQGSFSHSIPHAERADELGDLARAAVELQGHLLHSVNSMTAVVEGLKHNTQELESASGEIQQGAGIQSERAELVATAMHEMAATVREIAQNTAAAANASEVSRQTATSGGEQMALAAEGMRNLEQQVNSLSEKLENLIKETDRVGSVVEVIGSIAEQTNLLALNAAIESARAGEHGRGFAVVADEVRTLAGRTQASTQEISEIIASVQRGANEVIDAMHASKQETTESVSRVEQGHHSLGEIIESVSSINDMTLQVATGAEEQGQVAEDINRNVQELADITSTTLAQSIRVRETVRELSSLADEIDAAVNSLTRTSN